MFKAQVWGVACGGALGWIRTRDAALHLLDKNQALEALGIPPLPGAGHWEAMASWGPAGAGFLFFGLSLGLGWGTLFGLWCKATGAIPGRVWRWVPWVGLAIPCWALGGGDLGLAVSLLLAFVGALAASSRSSRHPSAERLLVSAACIGVLALGSLPWALVPGGPFTHLRDRFLLSSDPGLAFESFYYRWTLYPAEVLKPLRAKTQPTVSLPPEASPTEAETLCREALQIRALCLPPGESGADARLEGQNGDWEVVLDDARETWPRSRKSREEAWEDLSRRADPSAPLRAFTGWALAGGYLTTRWPTIPRYLSILLGGCPLALLWGFTAASLAAGGWLPRGWQRFLASTLCAGIIAAALAWAGLPDPEVESAKEIVAGESTPGPEALTGLLHSTRPALRFHAVRAAHRLGPDARPLLLDALSDPVINVRYAAAEALGRIGGPEAQAVLLTVLTSAEEWYVKERAYAGLWRLGWRPRQGP